MTEWAMNDISENAKKIWHLTAPGVLIACLFILNIIPHAIPEYGTIKPDLILIVIFYWSVHRPTIMPPSISFILGLLMDVFSAFPLGLNAFIFVLVQKFISDQRKLFLGQPYYVLWIGFAFICVVANALKTAVFTLMNNNLPSTGEIALHVGLTVAIFPLITILLIGAHKLMLKAERRS